MAKTRAQKQKDVEALADALKRMKSVVFASSTGITVPEMTELRKKMRAGGVEYHVVKKTLLTLALRRAGIKGIDVRKFETGLGLALGFEDEVLPAKLLDEFRKEREEKVALLGGIVSGEIFDAVQISALAKLPSKQELLAKIVGSLAAPLRGFLTVVSGPTRGFVQVLRSKSTQS